MFRRLSVLSCDFSQRVYYREFQWSFLSRYPRALLPRNSEPPLGNKDILAKLPGCFLRSDGSRKGAVRKVNRPGPLLVTYFVPAHNLEQGDKAVLPKNKERGNHLGGRDYRYGLRPVRGSQPSAERPGARYGLCAYQQWDAQLHSLDRALDAGTLFPILDKPFTAEGGSPVE